MSSRKAVSQAASSEKKAPQNVARIESLRVSMLDRWDAILFAVVLFYLFLCPYTKVEESFNLQAMHDMLFYDYEIEKYDHHEFPGVVPRTFIGSLIVSFIARPIWTILYKLGLDPVIFKFGSLLAVRGVLGLLYVYAMALFRRAFSQWHYGRQDSTVAALWTVIVATQFHANFYASRTLPNTFALILVLVGYHFWLRNKRVHTVVVFTFAALVFRSELAMLFAPMVIDLLFNTQTPFSASNFGKRFLILFGTGVATIALSLALTVGIDSFFWERILWPEGELLYFNTILNKSHEYGVSPFHWYFTSAIPKAMAFSLLLVPLGLVLLSKEGWFKVAPIFVFLGLYSFLPHKELRFIFYALPILNMVATIALRRLADLKGAKKLVFFAALGLVLSCLFSSAFLAFISHHNYPGGTAVNKLHTLADTHNTTMKVHLDAAPCQTGFSRFLESHPRVEYYKTEGLASFDNFTHRITDRKSASTGVREPSSEIIDSLTWRVVDTVYSFSNVNLQKTWPFLQLNFAPSMFIYERIDWNKAS